MDTTTEKASGSGNLPEAEPEEARGSNLFSCWKDKNEAICAGVQWAQSNATIEKLSRLDDAFRSWAYIYTDGARTAVEARDDAQKFWDEHIATKLPGDVSGPQPFLVGFVEGALYVWDEAKHSPMKYLFSHVKTGGTPF